MSNISRVLAIVSIAAGLILMFLGQTPLALLFGLVAVATVALSAMRQSARAIADDPSETLDPESRALYVPIRRLTSEIDEFVAQNSDSTVVKVVGRDARDEADRIRRQAAHALQVRSELRRSVRGRSLAERELKDLSEKIETSLSPEEKTSLEGAREARQQELEHYRGVEGVLTRIDSGIRQAESALSEMKARLTVGASGEKAEAVDSDDIRETIGRMKALSLGYEEAEQFLKES